MKKFEYELQGKRIELTIKDKISNYSCVIDLLVDGKVVALDTKASISFIPKYPNKAFLSFESDGIKRLLCICDLENEKADGLPRDFPIKNREITTYLHKHLQDCDFYSELFRFTESHWANMED